MSTPKKIRARKMWANIGPNFVTIHATKRAANYEESEITNGDPGNSEAKEIASPVLVLPGSAEAVEAAIEQGAKALHRRDMAIDRVTGHSGTWGRLNKRWRDSYLAKSRAVLSANGITAGKTRGTK